VLIISVQAEAKADHNRRHHEGDQECQTGSQPALANDGFRRSGSHAVLTLEKWFTETSLQRPGHLSGCAASPGSITPLNIPDCESVSNESEFVCEVLWYS
jgi:hypothetical protein